MGNENTDLQNEILNKLSDLTKEVVSLKQMQKLTTQQQQRRDLNMMSKEKAKQKANMMQKRYDLAMNTPKIQEDVDDYLLECIEDISIDSMMTSNTGTNAK